MKRGIHNSCQQKVAPEKTQRVGLYEEHRTCRFAIYGCESEATEGERGQEYHVQDSYGWKRELPGRVHHEDFSLVKEAW